MKRIAILIILGMTAWTIGSLAQEDGGQPPGPTPGGKGGKPPTPPIEATLDANGDGTIDADEIANAPTALKKLDKNGDGKLTSEEYRPSMPSKRMDRRSSDLHRDTYGGTVSSPDGQFPQQDGI
jgi:hypothetical protein